MDYAIIRLGNKQHRVRDGERLVVDRLPGAEGESFAPDVLLGAETVTATVIAHERGPKIVIGKYRRRTGYKRRNGFRAATTRVEISLGGAAKAKPAATRARAKQPPAEPAVEQAPAAASESAIEAPAESVVEAPAGLPEGFAKMTVAQITAGAKEWSHAELEAALAHEQAHAARKGALAAIEAALAREES